MTNKYVKKCSTSLATKEMQTEMTMTFHLTPVRAGINNTTTCVGEDGVGGHLSIVSGNVN
jgi:hypothetical protein